MIGKTISHYQILEKLGEGGMGVVYKARDTKLDRDVALKFLPPRQAASEQDRARFVQEAKAAAALSHPNVCPIHDIRDHDDQMFIVMEFVEGQTLREKIGSVNLKQAVDIAIQVADGLAAAHEKGIVHRDIKPENIMIRRDGVAQIMDFGLAKLRASGSAISRLTKEGSTVGTAGYMSPEQVRGDDADHRSDIFSYGVLLYELFTGQLPFKGAHEMALAYEIVNVDPPPPSVVKSGLDPGMDAIILECLEKDPGERTQSIKQISVDLKRYKRGSSRQRASRITSTAPAAAGRVRSSGVSRPGVPWAGISGYVLAAIMGIALFLVLWGPLSRQSGDSVPVVRAKFDLPMGARVVWNGYMVLSLSPDGRSLVYQTGDGRLILHHMDETTSRPIPGVTGSVPAFSPDGQSIVFNDGRNISRVSLAGTGLEAICPVLTVTPGLFWAPDNTILFGSYIGPVMRVSASGGTPVPVSRVDTAAGEISHRVPQLLPDGKTVIFTVKTRDLASFDDAVIVAERIDNGERKVLVRGGMYGRYVPSGHLVYVRGKSILAVKFDPDRLEVEGSPVPVEEGGVLSNTGGACFGVSDNGILVYSPVSAFSHAEVATLGWMDRNGGLSSLYDTLTNFNEMALSPDETRVAARIAAANDDIWIYNIPRGVLTRLTFGWGNNGSPVWSPDGKYLVYSAEKGGTPNIYRQPWDGNGTEERLTTSSIPQNPVSISPDGKILTFNENGDIWILPLHPSGVGKQEEPSPFIQTPAEEYGGTFSADGRWITYVSDESGKPEVYVISFPDRKRKIQVSNTGGDWSTFSRNGKSLFYGRGQKVMGVDVSSATSTLELSVPRKVLDVPSNMAVADVNADGGKFLVVINHTRQELAAQLNVVSGWFEVLKSRFKAE